MRAARRWSAAAASSPTTSTTTKGTPPTPPSRTPDPGTSTTCARASYFADTISGPRRAREVRVRTRVRGLTPTPSPSPSPSPPPPPRMTEEEEEAQLMERVMEDSMMTHDERQWPGLDRAMALSAAGDVAIPEQMEEEEVAAFPPELVGASWAGCAPRRRWRT
ncbi:hypothetical protein D1007_30654 [Hordeum vulgare]|nr:hypothetical protein D1007_30654 [Hordeum vulgare]